MAAGTAASRVSGFARTAALATALGLTTLADAYNAAAALPTMLLVLVTGGTLSSAVVPLLVRPETVDARRRAAGAVLVTVGAVTALATVLLALASPALGRVLAVSAPADVRQQRAELTGDLLLLFAPQVFLFGVSVVACAVLTAAGRLARVGVTPVLTNLVTLLGIGGYVLLADGGTGGDRLALLALGAGSTVGLALTTAVQLRGCRDLLPSWRSLRSQVDRAPLRELAAVSRWSLVYVAANQVGLVVVLIVTGARTGVLSAYQWSFAVMQLPYAILAVSALSATYPAMTRAADDVEALRAVVQRTAGLLILLLIPAAAAMAVFGDVVAAILLGAGASARDVDLLTTGVRLFALALLPFSLFQLLNRISYARRAPRLPALSNLAVNAVTVGGALLAAGSDSAPRLLRALALVYALSYAVGCVVLLRLVGPAGSGIVRPDRRLLLAVAPSLGATAVAAALRAGTHSWPADLLAALLVAAGSAVALRAVLRARSGLRAAAPTP